MSQASYRVLAEHGKEVTSTMQALVFHGPDQISVEEVPIPRARAGEAIIRITLTTICGTDLHILKGEYPVKPGLIIGHEPVGVIHELDDGVTGYPVGDRVLVGAITPCGQCNFCLGGNWSQCGGAIGGWKFGNTIDGAQAEYLRVPNAQANLAKIPDELTDEQVVLLGRYCLHWYFRSRKRRSPNRRQRCYFRARANRPLRNCRYKTERCESDYHCGFRCRANGDVETDGGRCGSRLQQTRCSRADQAFDKRKRR